jgi:hypothetical protein
MKKISTTQLAKLNNIKTNELFDKLKELELIDENKKLTQKGIEAGG